MPKRRSLALWALLSCVMLTSGCWGRTEINDLAIAIAASIDEAPDEKIRFSEQVFVPNELTGAPGTGKPFFVITGIGNNIREAHKDLQRQLSRRLFIADRNLYLIGEDIARKGIGPYMDEITRNPQSRLRTGVAVTEGQAVNYLKVRYPFEYTPGAGLRKLVFGVQSNYDVDVKTVMRTLDNRGDNVMMPVIGLAPSAPGGPSKFRVSGLAVFKKDRMIGRLKDDEAKGVMWLRDQMRNDTQTLNVPGHQGRVSCVLLRERAEYDVRLQNGLPAMTVTLRPELTVQENNTSLDLNRPSSIAIIEKLYNAQVRQQAETALQKLQRDFGADILGFSDRVYRAEPDAWEQSLGAHWNEAFQKLPVTIRVDAKIRRVGMTGASVTRTDSEIESE